MKNKMKDSLIFPQAHLQFASPIATPKIVKELARFGILKKLTAEKPIRTQETQPPTRGYKQCLNCGKSGSSCIFTN